VADTASGPAGETGAARELEAREVFSGCSVDDLGELPEPSSADGAAEVDGLAAPIGQERAQAALDFAVELPGPGHHIYILGPTGTGRHSYTTTRLAALARKRETPPDLCYVADFHDNARAALLHLPAGQGPVWAERVRLLTESLVRELRATFEGEAYQQAQERAAAVLAEQIEQLVADASQRASQMGFALANTPTGLTAVPVDAQGHPLSDEQLEQMTGEERGLIALRAREVHQDLQEVMRRRYILEREARDEAIRIRTETARAVTRRVLEGALKDSESLPELHEHLEHMVEDVATHPERLLADPPGDAQGGQMPVPLSQPQERYALHVFVTHPADSGAPVMYEPNPTYYNLFGRVQYRATSGGGAVTDFTQVQPGAMQRANGGFLVLDASRLLEDLNAFSGLLRALRSRTAKPELLLEQVSVLPYTGLRVDPVDLDVRVVLIGSARLLEALTQSPMTGEEFSKLFSLHVEFEPDMPRTDDNCRRLAAFFTRVAPARTGRPLSPDGAARLIEYSARLVDDQRRLSTSLHLPLQLLDEAAHWATKSGRAAVDAKAVDEALLGQRRRLAAVRERLERAYQEGDYLLHTTGSAVGVVNGLAVYSLGDLAFGLPSRITARVWAGREGITDIEQVTMQSGPIHTKGVATLRAYLGGTYAHDAALSLSASISFEQMYGAVEGDSASSAELYALISALAEVPLRQDLAVTGSVSQWGEIQPVGGVNEKVEGFFRICQALGPVPSQGVLIPEANVHSLMLADDVTAAIREGRFHIYAVTTVEQGLALLTGRPAAEVHRQAQERLAQLRAEHDGEEGTPTAAATSVP